MGRNSTGARGGFRLGTRVVGASVLRRIRGPGGEVLASTSPERQARIGQLFDRGMQNKVGRVSVTVTRSGRLLIEQGRHRVIEAVRRGEKLEVTFRRGRGK